jgi:predicted metalloprotease with PDZ domain
MYNEIIRIHHLLPIKNISNAAIVKNYFNDPYYNLLAQLRGHIAAKELEFKLVQKGLSIDSIMREIYSEYKKTNKRINEQNLKDVFNKHLGKKLAKEFFEIIDDGKKITLSKELLSPHAELVYQEGEVTDLGFDLKAFFETQKIHNLNQQSVAYKAGLRNGHEIIRSNLCWLKPGKEVTLVFKENDTIKEIHFIPEIVKAKYPQYVLNDNSLNKLES